MSDNPREQSYVAIPAKRVVVMARASLLAIQNYRVGRRDEIVARRVLEYRSTWSYRLARWWQTRRGKWVEPTDDFVAAIVTAPDPDVVFDTMHWVKNEGAVNEDVSRHLLDIAIAAGDDAVVNVTAEDFSCLWGRQ